MFDVVISTYGSGKEERINCARLVKSEGEKTKAIANLLRDGGTESVYVATVTGEVSLDKCFTITPIKS